MKKEIIPSVLLTIACLVLFSGVYTAAIWGIAQFAPGKGEGFKVTDQNGKEYYENIAQAFTADRYFWPRPSAVGYNAAGSGGSNKGPANPDLLTTIQDRIDTFTTHNPTVAKNAIPIDMVTASGSGLDPDISVAGAMVQVMRIAHTRQLDTARVAALVRRHIEQPAWGMGPQKINTLKLNLELDNLIKITNTPKK